MEKIKICAITTISGTMRTFVIDSMEYLYQHGYEITIICDMDEEFIKYLPLYFKYISIPMKRKADLLGGFKAFLAFYKVFKENKFDMVQYATPNASFYASFAAWVRRVPSRVYCQWGIRYVGFTGLKRKVFKLFEKATCFFSTDIRPASYKNMEFAIQEGLFKSKKSDVIGMGGTIGIDLNKFDLNKKEEYKKEIRDKYNLADKKVFGFVGSVRRDKGVNELLGAFKELCEIYKNTCLIILGSKFADDNIDNELYTWSQNSDKVLYCGRIDEVYKYMAAMDIIVHPSYREGFSMVLQEAAAMELPIITTDIPGPSEVISQNETGLLVPARDTQKLKTQMDVLVNDETLCMKFGMEGRKRVEKYFQRSHMLELIYQDRTSIYKKRKGGIYCDNETHAINQ